ncbi:MFS transporter [Ornithinicoccus halotolerans]|uniref:MFS transporter n=1 Tax=Ornithinicoccus halotolerans TaxID=1748220 RepID=UPI001296851C|nr:MFS transporter [Ornithinicoccus halotolerans]
MFGALRVKNYRIYATGAVISNTGTWMGRVAQDWVVLTELTDHSARALGVVTGLQFLPMLLLSPLGGVLSDAFPKRRVMMLTQSLMALTAVAMGVLVITGAVELWHMYVLAFVQGTGAALDAPARQSFVSEMVPRERLTNAVGLNSASFHTGRLLGPATAGLLIAVFGTGPTFLVNAATFVAVLVALLAMDPRQLTPAPRSRGKGRIREGVAYVRHRPDIIMIMMLAFVHGTFGMNFQMTNALMITEVFGREVTDFGVTGSVMAVGSLGGALLAAKRDRPRLRYLFGALASFAACSLLVGLAPSFWFYAVMLVPTGLSALTVMVTANALVQLSVDPAVRGRVLSLYMMVFMGGTPVGAPVIGWIGEQFGARWTILIATITVGGAVLAAVTWVMRTDNLRVRVAREQGRLLVLERGPVEPVPERAV